METEAQMPELDRRNRQLLRRALTTVVAGLALSMGSVALDSELGTTYSNAGAAVGIGIIFSGLAYQVVYSQALLRDTYGRSENSTD